MISLLIVTLICAGLIIISTLELYRRLKVSEAKNDYLIQLCHDQIAGLYGLKEYDGTKLRAEVEKRYKKGVGGP